MTMDGGRDATFACSQVQALNLIVGKLPSRSADGLTAIMSEVGSDEARAEAIGVLLPRLSSPSADGLKMILNSVAWDASRLALITVLKSPFATPVWAA